MNNAVGNCGDAEVPSSPIRLAQNVGAGLRLHPSLERLKNFQPSGRKVGQQEAEQRLVWALSACDQSQPACR